MKEIFDNAVRPIQRSSISCEYVDSRSSYESQMQQLANNDAMRTGIVECASPVYVHCIVSVDGVLVMSERIRRSEVGSSCCVRRELSEAEAALPSGKLFAPHGHPCCYLSIGDDRYPVVG